MTVSNLILSNGLYFLNKSLKKQQLSTHLYPSLVLIISPADISKISLLIIHVLEKLLIQLIHIYSQNIGPNTLKKQCQLLFPNPIRIYTILLKHSDLQCFLIQLANSLKKSLVIDSSSIYQPMVSWTLINQRALDSAQLLMLGFISLILSILDGLSNVILVSLHSTLLNSSLFLIISFYPHVSKKQT